MSHQRLIEFCLDDIKVIEGAVYVIGRNYDAPLVVGDKFISVYSTNLKNLNDKSLNVREISLKISKINLFVGASLLWLEPGFTCELVLEGTIPAAGLTRSDILSGMSALPVPTKILDKCLPSLPEQLNRRWVSR